MKVSGLATIFAVFVLIVGSNQSSANFINGSFENGNYSFDAQGANSLGVGSTAITGWTTFGGELAVIQGTNSFGISSPFGDKFLDLTGYHDSSPYGGVQQSVGTVVGQSYLVSLYLGVNATAGAPGPVSVVVSAGSSSATLTANPTGSGDLWTLETFSFVANSTSTLVSIQGDSTANGHYIGLDNVSIAGPSVVPEPASLVLFGIGLLGVIGRTRLRRGRA
jgi:hypothetical protein